MKKDLFIIPGSVNPKIANHNLSQPIIKSIRRLLKVTLEIKFKYDLLMKNVSSQYNKIHFIDYKRELFGSLSKSNVKMIIGEISKIKNDYDVVCFSAGGHLFQEALKKENIKKPKKVILMCSLNTDKNMMFPDKTKVFNIYSKKDFLIKYSIFLLSFGKGNQHLKNADNIIIDNMYHSEIESDKKIDSGIYKGLTGFELVEKLLSV